jgi:hypothetical protein
MLAGIKTHKEGEIMSDEAAKQNGQTQAKGITQAIATIIVGILGFSGGILTLVIQQQCSKPEKPVEKNLEIALRDADTGERVAGYIFINGSKLGTFIDSINAPPNIPLAQGRYTIRAQSDGYVDVIAYIDHIGAPLSIPQRRMQSAMEFGEEPPGPVFIPLPMSGWYPWERVTITGGTAGNECVINSRGRLRDSAGIVNEHLGTALRGRTLILCFSNTSASRFNGGRMAKLEGDNLVLLADNAFSVLDYLPTEDRMFPNGFEFRIPDTFNGKLNIVFYQAELNDLRITAYYR